MSSKEVYATYIGRRMTVSGKLAYFWLFDGEDKARGYKKQLIFAQPGEVILFKLADSGEVYVSGKDHGPKRTTKTTEHKTLYVAEDQANYQMWMEAKADRRMKEEETDFDRALKPLRNLIAQCRFHDDKAALINRITSELWRR